MSVNETLCMAATQVRLPHFPPFPSSPSPHITPWPIVQSKLQQAMSRRRGPAQLTEEQQPQEASQAPRSAGRNKKNSSNVAALGGEMPWHLEELSKHQVRIIAWRGLHCRSFLPHFCLIFASFLPHFCLIFASFLPHFCLVLLRCCTAAMVLSGAQRYICERRSGAGSGRCGQCVHGCFSQSGEVAVPQSMPGPFLSASLALLFAQAPAIVVACFLETIDRWIGQDHLFKRSVLLIKVRRDRTLHGPLPSDIERP